MGGRGPPGCGAPSGSGIHQRGAVGSPLGDGPRRRPGREGSPRAVRVPAGDQLRVRSRDRLAAWGGKEGTDRWADEHPRPPGSRGDGGGFRGSDPPVPPPRRGRRPERGYRHGGLCPGEGFPGGQPERARAEFQAVSSDRSVVGFIGPLTGEEGLSVSVVFDPKSPPVFYLGQKHIPEKPFFFSFGLTPQQEARAVLSHLAGIGKDDLILFHPDNGYGRGFADAVTSAAKEAGGRGGGAGGHATGTRPAH